MIAPKITQHLSLTMRHLGFEPLATWRPAPQRRHIGFGPGFVDEHQAGGIDPLPIFGPLRSPTSHVGTVPLGGNPRLFL